MPEACPFLQERDFTIVFRSFGEDIPAVMEEMNMFCTGQHPQYPGVRPLLCTSTGCIAQFVILIHGRAKLRPFLQVACNV